MPPIIGAAILFFVSWENRIKRSRALKAIHELRAMAHIIDMHQLTKQPESCFAQRAPAAKRTLTPFELNRYLDYCSETLALISKIAALYVQDFDDPVTLSAVRMKSKRGTSAYRASTFSTNRRPLLVAIALGRFARSRASMSLSKPGIGASRASNWFWVLKAMPLAAMVFCRICCVDISLTC